VSRSVLLEGEVPAERLAPLSSSRKQGDTTLLPAQAVRWGYFVWLGRSLALRALVLEGRALS